MSRPLSRRHTFAMVASVAVLMLAGCRGSAMSKYAQGHTKEEGLVSAAGAGDLGAVNGFLGAGVDVNARNAHGSTALMDASAGGHLDVVQALLAKGADVNLQNEDGWTALHAAANSAHRLAECVTRTQQGTAGEVDSFDHLFVVGRSNDIELIDNPRSGPSLMWRLSDRTVG